MTRTQPALVVTTNAAGWFAVCNLPVGIELFASATHSADSSGTIEVSVPWRGVRWRDFFVGPARRVVDTIRVGGAPLASATDSSRSRTDSASTVLARWTGSQIVRGTVRTSDGRSIAGAELRFWNTTGVAFSDSSGRFALKDVPAGTHTLDVRALGYVRDTRAVNVLANGDSNYVAMSLASVRSYLDTVRVTARVGFDNDANGFARRRRSNHGVFLSRDDVDKRPAIATTDLLTGMLGVRVSHRGMDNYVLVHGTFGECVANIFIDGVRYSPEIGGLDSFTWPSEIEGLEVYTRSLYVPAQFWVNDCGTILVWTNRQRRSARTPAR